MPGKCWPLAQPRTLSSPFGWRWGSLHDGQDFACPEGTPIFAAHDGVVSNLADPGGYGWYVQVDGDGVWSQYGHILAPPAGYAARHGATVLAGDLIAYSGNTGSSTGPHLHFRVRYTGGAPLDPAVWLQDAAEPGQQAPASASGDLADTTAGRLYRWGLAHGLSPAGACGVLGNLQAESNLDPAIVEGGFYSLAYLIPGVREGIGLLQWSYDRREALLAYAEARGEPWQTETLQADFLLTEVNASARYRQMWADLGAATDPRAASRLFSDTFVRPGVYGPRDDYAAEHYEKATAGRYDGGDTTNPRRRDLPAWLRIINRRKAA